MRGMWIAFLTMAVLGLGCSSSPGAAQPGSSMTASAGASESPISPSPSRSSVPSDLAGVTTIVDVMYPDKGVPGGGCGANKSQSGYDYSGCPLTQRLNDRIKSSPHLMANPICRCQSSWDFHILGVSFTAEHALARVSLARTADLDVVMVYNTGAWLIDDILCHGGGSNTSVYAADGGGNCPVP
jgi:hypothetical protein